MTQVLIALGSNMGDRLKCLEQGVHQVNSLPNTAVVNSSSLYSSAPAYDHLSGDHYLNCAIDVRTTIPVEELWTRLSGIEESMGPKDGRNAPRYLDLDIVYYGNLSCSLCYYGDMVYRSPILTIPHMRVHERFFVLRPLLDIAEDFVDPKRVKTIRELYADLEEKAQTDELLKVFHLDQPVVRVFPLGSGSKLQLVQSFEPTVFVGILNVTSDSFSDGGSLLDDNGILDPVSLIGKATDLIRGGASILDVGAESTRPKADPVDSRTQLRRVVPALTLLRAVFPKVLLSLDSRDPVTVEFCYNEGLVDLVNDTSGLDHDSGLPELVSHFTGISVIVIHARGVPKTMDSKILYDDVATDVARELNIVLSRWLAAGVPRWRLIADFGFGFAKTVSQNRDIIASLDQVAASLPTGVPCMLGYSRKRFTRADLPKDAWTAADEAGKELFVQLKSRGIDQRALAFNRVHSMSLYEEFVVSNHCA